MKPIEILAKLHYDIAVRNKPVPGCHQPNNPLHGISLETILNELVGHYGWKELGIRIKVKCFNIDPSIKSSLSFLRKTPWARAKVETLYLRIQARRQSPTK